MDKSKTRKQDRRAVAARRQMIFIGAAVALAVVVIGYIVYLNNRPSGGDLAAYASGKSLGDPNARVVIQEFSDFQ